MTKQELMTNRYEVIANYPNSPFEIGDIVFKCDNTNVYAIKKYCGEYHVENPGEYPEIFKKLEWYEKRKIEEMPEYLKVITSINHNKDIGKVIKAVPGGLRSGHKGYEKNSWSESEKEYCSGFDNIILSCFEPATEEEYLSYLENSK